MIKKENGNMDISPALSGEEWRTAMDRRFQLFSQLLDPITPLFEEVARSDGWEFKVNGNRQPSRELHKISSTGRTTFMIGVLLDQSWLSDEGEAKYPDDLTYTFCVVLIIQGATPERIDLLKSVPMSDVIAKIDPLMDRILRFVHEFVEP